MRLGRKLVIVLILTVLAGCIADLADDGFPNNGAPDFSAGAHFIAPLGMATAVPGTPVQIPLRLLHETPSPVPLPTFTPTRC